MGLEDINVIITANIDSAQGSFLLLSRIVEGLGTQINKASLDMQRFEQQSARTGVSVEALTGLTSDQVDAARTMSAAVKEMTVDLQALRIKGVGPMAAEFLSFKRAADEAGGGLSGFLKSVAITLGSPHLAAVRATGALLGLDTSNIDEVLGNQLARQVSDERAQGRSKAQNRLIELLRKERDLRVSDLERDRRLSDVQFNRLERLSERQFIGRQERVRERQHVFLGGSQVLAQQQQLRDFRAEQQFARERREVVLSTQFEQQVGKLDRTLELLTKAIDSLPQRLVESTTLNQLKSELLLIRLQERP